MFNNYFDMKEDEKTDDKTWIVKKRKITEDKEGVKIWESVLTDSNSSRSIVVKTFYHNEIVLTTPGLKSAFLNSSTTAFLLI